MATLQRSFHYHCSLVYADVCDINYTEESIVLEDRKVAQWQKCEPQILSLAMVQYWQ